VTLAFVSTLGAFQELAVIYIPTATLLFSRITASGGIASVVFLCTVIFDSCNTNPVQLNPHEVLEWRQKQWLKSSTQAHVAAWLFASVAAGIIGYSILLRNTDVPAELPVGTTYALLNAALAVCLAGTGLGVLRSRRPDYKKQRSLRSWEAGAVVTATTMYTGLLILSLPF
jgi:hypothetical protein